MNKAKNLPPQEKRKTRTYLVTVDEQKYLDSNFIDNYYRKKKSNKIDKNAVETQNKKEISLEKLSNANQPEILTIKEEDIKLNSNCDKDQSIGPSQQLKPVKKVNKRYQELLENSLLVFDKPKKQTFSVIKDFKNQSVNNAKKILGGFEANLVEQLNLNSKELELNLKFKQDDTKKKIFRNKQEKNLFQNSLNTKSIKNKNQQLLQSETYTINFDSSKFSLEYLSVYQEINNIRFLGQKRRPPLNLNYKISNENSHTSIYENINPLDLKKLNSISIESLSNNFFDKNTQEKLKTTINLLHEPRFKENKTFSYGEFFVNSYEKSLRREHATSMNFIKEFNQDYKPILLQKENEKLFQNDSTQSDAASSVTSEINLQFSKTHFIKKKQSSVNIKRQCGVSYVRASESVQKDVTDRYQPLGHLVYQGTYSISTFNEETLLNKVSNIIETELMTQPLLLTYFESQDESEMKEYLLVKEKRLSIAKDIFIVNSLDDIWKFAKDRHFLCINLLLDKNLGIRNFTNEEIMTLDPSTLLTMSDVQIGIIFRKATSGIKSVLKLYKNGGLDVKKHLATFKLSNITPNENIDLIVEKLSGSNMQTLSMRIELYVGEQQWKCSNMFTKQFLYTFMSLVEEKIIKLILNWNEYRYLLSSMAKDSNEFNSNRRIYKLSEINNKEHFDISSKENVNNHDYKDANIENAEFDLEKIDKAVNFDKETLINSIINRIPDSKIIKHESEINYLIEKRIIKEFKYEENLSHPFFLINYTSSPLPMYIISTRDCFVFDLNVKEEIIEFKNRKILKKEYFFDESNIPGNFYKFKTDNDDYRVGVVTYENYYSHEELLEIENDIVKTEELSIREAYLPETAQKTYAGDKLKRTKFFFGSRYMWTKKQLVEPNSYVAAGIRKDVSPAPFWMKKKIENPLCEAGIIKENFVNSYALNVYHDGTEGLGQHFDDAVRFKQPIYTLRLFSDCRLSFGSQLYGYCNGAFTIPLPRGCICVMEENSYASNGVKHCIRPCDMTGKSSALILRQMHPIMVKEAENYDFYIDFPCWLSTLSINENSVSYATQKNKESEFIIKVTDYDKKHQNNKNLGDPEVLGVIEDILFTFDLVDESEKNFNVPVQINKSKNDF